DRSFPPPAAGARFDKSPVEQKSGLARFGRDDLLGDVAKIRSSDVRLRTERIEDLPGSGDEGCDASRTERAHDIPRVRCHESKSVDRKSKRVCDRLVRLGGWLEATDGVYRERTLEEGGQAGVGQLLLQRRWRGVRQRDQSQACISHRLKTVPHIGMCGK